MNRRISAIAVGVLAASMFATMPAMADVFGVAEKGDVNSVPSSSLTMPDPAGLLPGQPGYLIQATTTLTSFAGMNWPGVNKPVLGPGDSGYSAPDYVQCVFEVPTGALPQTSNAPDPNLTIVVQDVNADYYYAGKNQGLVSQYDSIDGGSGNGWDLFILQAQNGPPSFPGSFQFNQANSTTNTMGIVNEVAVVWSGYQPTGNPITTMYVSIPAIHSKNKSGKKYILHVPANYNTNLETLFNFQVASPNSAK